MKRITLLIFLSVSFLQSQSNLTIIEKAKAQKEARNIDRLKNKVENRLKEINSYGNKDINMEQEINKIKKEYLEKISDLPKMNPEKLSDIKKLVLYDLLIIPIVPKSVLKYYPYNEFTLEEMIYKVEKLNLYFKKFKEISNETEPDFLIYSLIPNNNQIAYFSLTEVESKYVSIRRNIDEIQYSSLFHRLFILPKNKNSELSKKYLQEYTIQISIFDTFKDNLECNKELIKIKERLMEYNDLISDVPNGYTLFHKKTNKFIISKNFEYFDLTTKPSLKITMTFKCIDNRMNIFYSNF